MVDLTLDLHVEIYKIANKCMDSIQRVLMVRKFFSLLNVLKFLQLFRVLLFKSN